MNSFLKYSGDLSCLSKSDLQDLYRYLQTYRIRYRKILNISMENSFGVEIEFGNIPLIMVRDILNDDPEYQYWSVGSDESVEEYQMGILIGGEVSSDILHDQSHDWILLSNVLKYLKTLGANATNKTAFHIHVGAQIFNEDLLYLKRFIKVWCIFEDIIFRFSYGKDTQMRPFINDFAKPIAPLFKALYEQNPSFLDSFTTTKMFDFGKKRAVSFKNYHFLSNEEIVNNTIEIRCPNGTLDRNIAQNNINFFLKLMMYVTSDAYDPKLIDHLFMKTKIKSLEDYNVLDIKKALLCSDLIFQNSLDKMNFLKQYIKKDFDMVIR